jgi:Bacterial surface protein, Ig-like domain/Secretion system C-terminal sorting domain
MINTPSRIISTFIILFDLLGFSQNSLAKYFESPIVFNVCSPQPSSCQAKPQIVLLGNTPEYVDLIVGIYSEPGWNAIDSIDGNISQTVQVHGTVNTMRPDIYTLMYTVTNSCGHSDTVYRDVIVGDFLAPIISARYSDTVLIYLYDSYDVRNYINIYDTWTDSSYLFDHLEIGYNNVDTAVTGNYKTTVVTSDSFGHTSDSFTLAVVVKDTSTSGVGLQLLSKAYYLFPNPSSGLVYIRSNKLIQSIQIINAIGKEVYTRSPTLNHGQVLVLDLEHLPRGYYICTTVMHDSTKRSQKLFLH